MDRFRKKIFFPTKAAAVGKYSSKQVFLKILQFRNFKNLEPRFNEVDRLQDCNFI